MSRITVPRLVLITNRASARFPLSALATKALAGGVDMVQIREKDLTELELLNACREVLDAGVAPERIMVNGSPRVAEELGIGLHLPENADQPPIERSETIPSISRSVHSPESAAESAWTDFVIAGHVFETASKPGLPPIGLAGLDAIVRRSPVPVVAIGGIKPEFVAAVMSTGVSGVAVLSGINDAADPEGASLSFKLVLENVMAEATEIIDVTVNGKSVTIAPDLTVLDYLGQRGLHERMVVVELNGVILKKAVFASTLISAGDKIEIVHFVGGG